jgi:hypothetical protein
VTLLFANPTGQPLKSEWRLDTEKMGRAWAGRDAPAGKIAL